MGGEERRGGSVVGECSERMSAKAGIPQGSNKGLRASVASHNAWLCHRHGDPSLSNKREFQDEGSAKA